MHMVKLAHPNYEIEFWVHEDAAPKWLDCGWHLVPEDTANHPDDIEFRD